MITPGRIVADIGTDHGYIPIYEVLTGRAGYAYACDVAEGPLGRARDNVSLYNVGDRVQTVLSDGLKGLKNIKDNIPEAIVIAGMGGSLICRILSEGAEAARNAKELILAPHSEWYKGYLVREADPGDRRRTLLRCTEKACPIIEQGRALQEEFGARLLEHTNEAQRKAFFETMDIINENLDTILEGEA